MILRLALVIVALSLSACNGSTGDNGAADQDSAIDAMSTSPSATETVVSVLEAQAPVPLQGPIEIECGHQSVSVGLHTGTFVSGDATYEYRWTVPSSYVGDPIPVVLDFHGIGSNGADQADFSGWAAKAEAEGFLSVQPTGISIPGDDRASWELPQFDTPHRDDVAMVLDLIEVISSNVCVDSARIYATGMSNGGFFTSQLVCSLSETIAAAVSVAGVTHHDSCAPTRPVPYLAFHGTADEVVPFAGGGETTLGSGGSYTFFDQVMPEEFAEFAADFGCTESSDGAVTTDVTLTSWTGCDADIEVGFYTIEGGGHTWPGSRVSAATPSRGVTNLDVDATDISWRFFQRHSLIN